MHRLTFESRLSLTVRRLPPVWHTDDNEVDSAVKIGNFTDFGTIYEHS